MTNENYRPILTVRLALHSTELCDKVGTEISKNAPGLAVDDMRIISVKQNPGFWYITRKKVPQPHFLGCSEPRTESVASEPRDSDYIDSNVPIRSVEWSKAVEISVYTDVRV